MNEEARKSAGRIDFQALRDRRRMAWHFLLLLIFVSVGGTVALFVLSLLNR